MSGTIWIWSHLQAGLLLSAGLSLLLGATGRGRTAAVIAAGALFPLLPIDGVDLAGRLYAHSGALSLTGLVLLAVFVTRRLGGPELLPLNQRRGWRFGIVVLGLLLYPMSLGLGEFDPYGLGFAGLPLPALLAATAVLLWFTGRRPGAMLLLAVLWCWLLGLGESDNLWDYLLDLWTFLAALFIWIRRAFTSRFRD